MSISTIQVSPKLEGLRDAFYRRLHRDDQAQDSEAAVLAQSLIDEVRADPERASDPAKCGDVEAGRIAMGLLDKAFWEDEVEEIKLPGSFPKTRAALIDAVFAAWASAGWDDKQVPEIVFARFMARAMKDWDKKERDATRPCLQNILRLLHSTSVPLTTKIARFLVASEPDDDPEMIREMGRGLSHYATHNRVILMAQAYLIHAPDVRPTEALTIALPELVAKGEKEVRLAETGMRIALQLGGTPPYRVEVKEGEIRLTRTVYADGYMLTEEEAKPHKERFDDECRQIVEWWGHVDMRTKELLFLKYEIRCVRGNGVLFTKSKGLVLEAN